MKHFQLLIVNFRRVLQSLHERFGFKFKLKWRTLVKSLKNLRQSNHFTKFVEIDWINFSLIIIRKIATAAQKDETYLSKLMTIVKFWERWTTFGKCPTPGLIKFMKGRKHILMVDLKSSDEGRRSISTWIIFNRNLQCEIPWAIQQLKKTNWNCWQLQSRCMRPTKNCFRCLFSQIVEKSKPVCRLSFR